VSQIPTDLIQTILSERQLDGWLLYDFHGQNPISKRVARFPEDRFATRRWFYFLPAKGEPVGIVHAIERHHLDHLPGRKLVYAGWREMRERLSEATAGATRIAMEYSPECNIPYISRVDAGTVELLKGLGKDIESSADLVSIFESRFTPAQVELHREAARATTEAKDRAFTEIKQRILAGEKASEYQTQQFILEQFAALGLVTSAPPIVAVDEHAGDPHYSPTPSADREIGLASFVLIDLWAKLDRPDGIYADFTWVGYVGPTVPARIQEIWEVVAGARDAAIDFVVTRVEQSETLRGYQVDDVARKFINQRGYGKYFFHRTGHNIGIEVHGNGAHLDNFETRDDRELLPFTAFSIEPGVYLDDFGIRSEVNMLLTEGKAEVTGEPIQREVLCLIEDE
jgi:Xaa-Pro aminopeptidase